MARTTLGEILERKRREAELSQQQMMEGSLKGQLAGNQMATKVVENKRAAEAKEFNPLNAIVSGGTAFVASGGNPLAAGVAALGSARGKKVKPLESIVSGGTTGISQGATSVQDLMKPENLDKLAMTAKQAGAPKKVSDALEVYAKFEAAKADKTAKEAAKTAEAEAKKEAEALRVKNDRGTKLLIEKTKNEYKKSTNKEEKTTVQNETYVEAMNNLKTSIDKYSGRDSADALKSYLKGYKKILDETFKAGELSKADYKEIMAIIGKL